MNAPQAAGLCPNPALEIPAAQLRTVGTIYIILRGAKAMQEPFVSSKPQSGELHPSPWHGAAAAGAAVCPQRHCVSLFVFLLSHLFLSSWYAWLFMMILQKTAICRLGHTQLTPTSYIYFKQLLVRFTMPNSRKHKPGLTYQKWHLTGCSCIPG